MIVALAKDKGTEWSRKKNRRKLRFLQANATFMKEWMASSLQHAIEIIA